MSLSAMDYDRTTGDPETSLILEGWTLIVEFCPCGCVKNMSEGEILALGPDAEVSLQSFHARPSGTLVLHSTLCVSCRSEFHGDERDAGLWDLGDEAFLSHH